MTRGQLLEDLRQAYLDARRHKRNKPYQQRFEAHLEENLESLCESLWNNRARTLKANFNEVQKYVITSAAGPNGSISPSGIVEVEEGTNKTFSIQPDAGCAIAKIFVDGVEVEVSESYTFYDVNCDHSIYVSFSGLGVGDEEDVEIVLYPNPAKDEVELKCSEMEKIALYEMTGRMVFAKETEGKAETLNISGLAKGIYILEVRLNNGQRCYKKLVKECQH